MVRDTQLPDLVLRQVVNSSGLRQRAAHSLMPRASRLCGGKGIGVSSEALKKSGSDA